MLIVFAVVFFLATLSILYVLFPYHFEKFFNYFKKLCLIRIIKKKGHESIS